MSVKIIAETKEGKLWMDERNIELITFTGTFPISQFPSEYHLYPPGTTIITKNVTCFSSCYPILRQQIFESSSK